MSSNLRELFSTQLKDATRATTEEQSIRQQTQQFNLALAAENAIPTLYPRQGTLNDIHTDRLLQKFKMSQQKKTIATNDDDDNDDNNVALQAPGTAQSLQSPSRLSSATRAVALPSSGSNAAKKSYEVLTVNIDKQQQQKKKKKQTKTVASDSDDDSDSSDAAAPYVDGTKAKPVIKKQHKKHKHRTADDGSGDDGEGSFDARLEKRAKSKQQRENDNDDGDDGESLGSKDSVDLDIGSLDEDVGDDDDDDADDDSIVDRDTNDDIVDDEVATRLRNARIAIERRFKQGNGDESSDSDDDGDFSATKGNGDDDDNGSDDDDDGSGSSSDAGDVDEDEEKRPRKSAKKSLSHAPSSKSKTERRSSNTMALDDGQQATKKQKSVASTSTNNGEKTAAKNQKKRKAERRENADWVTKDALNTVVSVACSQIFRRQFAKEKKVTNVSFFDLIMKDESDDAELQAMRGNLLAVSTIIQESLTLASDGSPKEMREIKDFVRNAKEIRTSSATNSTHTECGITGVTATAIAIELLEADHYTADGGTFTKKIFALKSLRKLIDSTAFLVNFHERSEQIVKDRLLHIKGYSPKMLVRDCAKLLADDPAQKNAATLLRTALKVHLDIVDMSSTIFKQCKIN